MIEGANTPPTRNVYSRWGLALVALAITLTVFGLWLMNGAAQANEATAATPATAATSATPATPATPATKATSATSATSAGQGSHDFQVDPTAEEKTALEGLHGNVPGFIIFESNREDGQFHLYRMNSDGTDVRRLTNTPQAKDVGESMYATISPDGSTIAWEHRYNSDDAEIWLMNSDGTNQRPLYEPSEDKEFRANRPSFLPDGRLKFTRSGSREKQTIWIYDFKTEDPKVGLIDKMLKKEPELAKNHQSWQETLLLAVGDLPKGDRFKTKRVMVHDVAPDLKSFVAWCKDPGRGVWWMSMDGKEQQKIHGGCSPRTMPDGRNFTWVMRAGRFGIGSMTTPFQAQVLFDGPYPSHLSHSYFPYLTPDYQWLVYAACPPDQHDHHISNYQLFIVKMGPDLKAEGAPIRLTFNKATDRYPIMWYPGMQPPATPPVVQGEDHKKFGGPDDPGI